MYCIVLYIFWSKLHTCFYDDIAIKIDMIWYVQGVLYIFHKLRINGFAGHRLHQSIWSIHSFSFFWIYVLIQIKIGASLDLTPVQIWNDLWPIIYLTQSKHWRCIKLYIFRIFNLNTIIFENGVKALSGIMNHCLSKSSKFKQNGMIGELNI